MPERNNALAVTVNTTLLGAWVDNGFDCCPGWHTETEDAGWFGELWPAADGWRYEFHCTHTVVDPESSKRSGIGIATGRVGRRRLCTRRRRPRRKRATSG